MDDAVILVDMARRVLAEEEEHPPVEERYTVVLEHCPSCGQTQGEGAEVRDPREAILPGCVERAMAGRSR